MVDARRLYEDARADPLNAAGYDKAVLAAAKAGEVARAGGASESVKRQTDDLLAELKKEAEDAEKDRRLLARILEVRGPREGPKYSQGDKGTMIALAEPTAAELFASAFREWGLDVDAVTVAEAVARLKERPAAVVTEVIAALDEWTSQRRVDGKPEAASRVAKLAAALDPEPSPMRRELREILARDQMPMERALGMLSAALRAAPVPVPVPLGRDCTRLRQLAEQTDPAKETVLGLLTLTRALPVAGEEALAERVLRAALIARPREVVLHHTLGQLLQEQRPPRWAEAVEFYRAARTLRPDLGVNLAYALIRSNREREGLDLLARMVKEQPDHPYLHIARGHALLNKHDLDEAVAAYSRALQLGGEDASVYNSRSVASYSLGLWGQALADIGKALTLQPDFPMAKNNLAWMLAACPEPKLRDPVRAVELAKQAVAAHPKESTLYTTLGLAHYRAGDWTAARNALQKSLELGQGMGSLFWFGRTTLALAMSHWQLGEKEKARTSYHQAVEWMAKNQPELEKDPARWAELRRFRAEADAVLAQPTGQMNK